MTKPKQMTKRGLRAAINREIKVIGDSRDRLLDLVSEAHAIADTADTAIDDLESAAESLSQYL